MSKFEIERKVIVDSLTAAGISNIAYNQYDSFKNLPAAVVTMVSEAGIRGTVSRYSDTDIGFEVYLVVNATKAEDPDMDVYDLKEAFREQYRSIAHRDIPNVEYYPGLMEARQVRIAKLTMLKSGIGAGS